MIGLQMSIPVIGTVVAFTAVALKKDILIQKIAEAVTGIARPFQIVRVARAEAEAALINAENELEISGLQRQAMERFIGEQTQQQLNINAITDKVFENLSEQSHPEDLDNDWIANFFQKCRIVSNEEMQSLWSNVLVGEVNSPSSFSRQTVNLLADLDARDAKSFERLLRFCCVVNGILTPFILPLTESVFTDEGFDLSQLAHLDSLGLVSNARLYDVHLRLSQDPTTIQYFNESAVFTRKANSRGHWRIQIGRTSFTRAGRELARIVAASPVPGFFEHVLATARRHGERIET